MSEIDFDDENDGFSGPSTTRNVQQPPAANQIINTNTITTTNMDQFQQHGAICIHRLDWMTNEEDVRGILVDANMEQQVEEIIFDEHKLNGKSKGNVYIEMDSTQSARALREYIETLGLKNNDGYNCNVTFMTPSLQPFNIKKSFTRNFNHNNHYHNNNRGQPHPPHFQQQSHYNQNQVPNYNPMFNNRRDEMNPHGYKRQRH